MPIPGLTIIGETINDSVPSTKKLFEAGDIAGILELARSQDEKGAAYIDVNVGPRSPEFMAEMVQKIQGVTAKPLSIDTPDPTIAKAGLEAYNLARAGGKKPILNSVSALRAGMFDLLQDSALSADSAGFRERGRRPIEALPYGPGDLCGGEAIGGDVFGPLWGRHQRRLHHRSGHRTVGQRFGGEYPPPHRRDGADPRRPLFCRLPRLGGLEQLHGDAPPEAGRRLAGERGRWRALSSPRPCRWGWIR